MTSLLIVAHAPLATSLQAVARHAYPDCSATLAAVDIDATASPAASEARIRAALATLPGPEVLVLVDVFGATPCNATLAAADGAHTRVVAGVNVPMLWRTLCYADMPLEELVARAVAGGSQGAMHVAVPRRQNQPNLLPNDHNPHHHQQ
jgi:PTS system mannose-specific IIA component